MFRFSALLQQPQQPDKARNAAHRNEGRAVRAPRHSAPRRRVLQKGRRTGKRREDAQGLFTAGVHGPRPLFLSRSCAHHAISYLASILHTSVH